jgi:tRNA uridine 5-carboxymethylaminomethyl modification enzyme
LFNENEHPEKILQAEGYTNLTVRNCQTIQASIKYAPYIEREEKEVERLKNYQTMKIPVTFDYINCDGLSMELRHKCIKHVPQTIAQASLIPGMTPAALSLLILKVTLAQK